MSNVADRILTLLDDAGVPHEVLRHDPTRSSEDAAAARGTPLALGTKCLVMKLDKGLGFAVVAIPAHHRLDNPRLRHHLGVRRYRFATRAELDHHTGLAPGAVPPFGRPVLDLPLYVDAGLATRPEMAFTAGRHDLSVRMRADHWLDLARPDAVLDLARPPD